MAKAGIAADPSTGIEIATAVVETSTKANPSAAADIAAAAFEAIVNSIPNTAPSPAADIAAQVVAAAAKANPSAAVEIATAVFTKALGIPEMPAGELEQKILDGFKDGPPGLPAAVAAALAAILQQPPAPQPAKPDAAPAAIESINGTSGKPAAPAGQPSSPGETTKEPPQPQTAAPQVQVPATAAGAEAQQAAPATPSRSLPESILKLISETVSRFEVGNDTAIIELKGSDALPGDVKLELKMENGGLSIRFEASDPQTRALLESGATALQSSLEAALRENGQQAAVSIQFDSPASSGNTSDSGGSPSDKGGEPGGERARREDSPGRGRVSAKGSSARS